MLFEYDLRLPSLSFSITSLGKGTSSVRRLSSPLVLSYLPSVIKKLAQDI
jgi:hypothetical protein